MAAGEATFLATPAAATAASRYGEVILFGLYFPALQLTLFEDL